MIAMHATLPSMAYSSVLEASLALYQEARYREAYDKITGAGDSPDAIPALVYYMRYSFASRAGMPDLAMELLQEVVMEKGYWYSSDHLGDDDLEPLRARPEFHRLVEICSKWEELARQNAISEVELISPRSTRKSSSVPLIVALHGNQLNIHTTKLGWCGESLSDCYIALPQSSRSVCTGAYSWVDPKVGAREVRDHMDGIFHKSGADQVILGGFSAGGRVALHLLLSGMVKARGVILLAPWLPDLVALEPILPILHDAGTKVCLICGDQGTLHTLV